MRGATDELHAVKGIYPYGSSARHAEEAVQRALINPKMDQALHLLELMDRSEREIGLDSVLFQALKVFDLKLRRRVGHHVRICPPNLGIRHMRSLKVCWVHHTRQVCRRGAARHRSLIRLGIDFGEHVARVVATPLCGGGPRRGDNEIEPPICRTILGTA
jgi:hypothetical protein